MKEIKNGLLPTKKDTRDFSATKVFGTIRDAKEIPTIDFTVSSPLEILDQKDTDMCAAFASVAVSEDQEGVRLSPEWFFMEVKKMMGDWKTWGSDLRTCAKVAVNLGFLKVIDNPFKLENYSRNFIADFENWENREKLIEKAKEHRKKSYFWVDGYYDIFDNIRATLWQNRNDKCSILTGTVWRSGWTNAENGIIPKTETNPLLGHALKIFGQKNINGELYLVAQLSNSAEIGDKGIFYFPREAINRDFTFGSLFFKDMPPEAAKELAWSKTRQKWEKFKKVVLKILIWLFAKPSNQF